MKNILLVLMFLFTISACTTTKIVYRDRIVEVPVTIFKEPPSAAEVEKPIYELGVINKDTSQDDVAKAYVITINQCLDYSKRLEIALQPFAEKVADEKDE